MSHRISLKVVLLWRYIFVFPVQYSWLYVYTEVTIFFSFSFWNKQLQSANAYIESLYDRPNQYFTLFDSKNYCYWKNLVSYLIYRNLTNWNPERANNVFITASVQKKIRKIYSGNFKNSLRWIVCLHTMNLSQQLYEADMRKIVSKSYVCIRCMHTMSFSQKICVRQIYEKYLLDIHFSKWLQQRKDYLPKAYRL